MADPRPVARHEIEVSAPDFMAVYFDAIESHLIALGWTPPAAPEPGDSESPTVCLLCKAAWPCQAHPSCAGAEYESREDS